jgi:hypothetical protein
MSKADNMLFILWLLKMGKRLTAKQLAEELEIHIRTVYRYIDALCASGVRSSQTADITEATACWIILTNYHYFLIWMNKRRLFTPPFLRRRPAIRLQVHCSVLSPS